jgi:hypothetical protein
MRLPPARSQRLPPAPAGDFREPRTAPLIPRCSQTTSVFYTNKHSKGGTGVPPVQAQAKACDYIK